MDNARIWTLEVPPVTNKQTNDNLNSNDKRKISKIIVSSSSDSESSSKHQNNFDQPSSLKRAARTMHPGNMSAEQMNNETFDNLEPGLPIVMIHGFAAGVAMWSLNIDELAERGNRSIYAFDILGFGKSSHPHIKIPCHRGMNAVQKSKAEAELMEDYLVESIEKWRQSIGEPLAGRFIILGHSFGGYLSLAYALRYPQHVAHIILADPWGLAPENHARFTSQYNNRQFPFWFRCIAKLVFEVLTPLFFLRALGPWGQSLIQKARPDLKKKFQRQPAITNGQSTLASTTRGSDADISSEESTDAEGSGNSKSVPEEEPSNFLDYIYHCNAQTPPSGEIAFKKLCTATAHARLPMLERIIELEPHIDLTFIYGSRSWVDRQSGFQAKYLLATSATSRTPSMIEGIVTRAAEAVHAANGGYYRNADTGDDHERVSIHVMQGAGHHVYADMVEDFNQLVLQTCFEADARLEDSVVDDQGMQQIVELDHDDSLEQQRNANAWEHVEPAPEPVPSASTSKLGFKNNSKVSPIVTSTANDSGNQNSSGGKYSRSTSMANERVILEEDSV